MNNIHSQDNRIARSIFHRVFKGQPNFMTPNFRGYYLTKLYAIELSEGDSISNVHTGNGGLFGVTVIERDGDKRRSDLSKSFDSWKDADDYIQQLRDLKH